METVRGTRRGQGAMAGMLTAAAVAVALSLGATALNAQSVTSVRGLGYPILPVDARAEVLGGIGIGLQGVSTSLSDPAGPAGTPRPGATVSVSAVEQTASMAGDPETVGATRFPLISVLYPVRGATVTLGYGAYLDQSWAAVREGEQSDGGTTFGYRDFVRSTGGIGQLQLGVAVPIGARFAVGASVGRHTGSRELSFQRVFDESGDDPLDVFMDTRTLEYSAPLAQLGARWDPIDILRVSASVTWAGSLSADSASGMDAGIEYDLPLRLAAGASAYLAPGLLAAVSGRWDGWSTVGPVDDGGFGGAGLSSARDTWEVGGGLEWDDPDGRSPRSYPIRLGGHYRQLPFTFGDEAPNEWFIGGGAGLRIGDPGSPIARLDLSVQRGERTVPESAATAELSESAWRFSASLSIFGN